MRRRIGSSRSYVLRFLTASGMNALRSTPSRGTGTATRTRFAIFSTRRVFSLLSTRCARSASQAELRTSMTPSSETHESARSSTPSSARIASSIAFRSGSRSSGRTMSILLMTMKVGLLANRGLMDWYSLHCMGVAEGVSRERDTEALERNGPEPRP